MGVKMKTTFNTASLVNLSRAELQSLIARLSAEIASSDDLNEQTALRIQITAARAALSLKP